MNGEGRPWRIVSALLAAALLARGAPAQTQALNRTGSGARAAGMANAFVAVSDDGTAASWNPAGLAQLRKPELALVHTSIRRSVRYEGFLSPGGSDVFSDSGDDYALASPEFASLAIPFDLFGRATTLQVDWRRQYALGGHLDLDVERIAPDASRTAVRQTLHFDGDIDSVSVAAAMKLFPRTSVGVSVSFWHGDWSENVGIVEPAPDGTSAFVSSRQRQSFRDANLNLGLLLSYPRWNVGLVYHAPFRASYSRSAAADSSLRAFPRLEVPDARLQIGDSLALGVAWRPAGHWTVAADITHDAWSDYLVDDCEPCGPGPTGFFDGQPADRLSTRDTTSLNLGAERLFTQGGHVIPLRFGLAWEPQGPMDPAERDPVNYRMAAIGTGFNTNRFKLDAAVQYRWARARLREPIGVAAGMGLEPRATGEISVSEWRVKVSLICRIADTGKLRRVLRRVFVDE